MSSSDRRRTARIAIVGRLHGAAISLDVPITVRDLSLGGMAVETGVAFPIGAVHEFQLTLGDGSVVLIKGRIMHSRNIAAPGDAPMFLTGVQFEDEESGAEPAGLGGMIDKLS